MPAADLSEQISTAGMEASGTGNMKFALNGALTIGTLDGANVEIKEHVGDDNIVIFGLTAEEVADKPGQWLQPAPGDRSARRNWLEALSAIASGVFSPDDPERYRDLIGGLYDHDWFMVARDFDAYAAAQAEVDAIWRNSPELVCHGDPQHRAMSAGSRRTGRSASMRTKSGAYRRDRIVRRRARELSVASRGKAGCMRKARPVPRSRKCRI